MTYHCLRELAVLSQFLSDILDILSFCLVSYYLDVLTFPDNVGFLVLLFQCKDI